MLRPAAEVSQVDWLLPYSATEPLVVQSYVSAGFPAYARVLNPANGFDGAAVRWSKIAQQTGVELTVETQWSDLAAEFQDEDELINLVPPDWSPDPAVASALTSVLRSHTSSPQDCCFLVWEGYASVADYFAELGAPKIAMSRHRSLFLLNGSLRDACAPIQCGQSTVAELVVAGGPRVVCGQRHLCPKLVHRRQPGVHRRGAVAT